MRLDDLARSATETLLAETTPDTEARLADLKRTRRHRAVTRAVAAGAVLAAVVGGFAVLRGEDDGRPEPAEPTYRNGALLIGSEHLEVVPSKSDHEPLRLPPDYSPDGDLAFAANGTELFYENSEHRIAAIDVDTGETRVLMPCPATTSCSIAPSPDGRWFAQVIDGRILLREVDGDDDMELETSGLAVKRVAWSPDGKTLALASTTGLYTMSISDPDPRLLAEFTTSQLIYGSVQWSPDGRAILFKEAEPLDTSPTGLQRTRFVLRVVEPEGSPSRTLFDIGACHCARGPFPDAAWAPDGTAIAAVRMKAPRARPWMIRPDGLYLITLDGRAERVGRGRMGTMAWQPVLED